MNEKITYGLSNVHWAPLTIDPSGEVKYGTPKRLYGATEFKASPLGETSNIYADNGVYYPISASQGYEVELSVHGVTRDFETYALGLVFDDQKGVLIEPNTPKAGAFALLFEFETDQKPTRHIFYNCTASRAEIESKTLEDKIEATPSTLKITAAAVTLGGDTVIRAKTTQTDSLVAQTVYGDWYKRVFSPAEVYQAAQPSPTADISFNLTVPATDGGNSILGGAAVKSVIINVANAISSVVVSAAKTVQQTLSKSGTNQNDVTIQESNITIDTSSISAAGGSKQFNIDVSEPNKANIKYEFTVNVAAAPPLTEDVTFSLTTPAEDGSTNTLEGGGDNKTVTVNVANGTDSVVINVAKASAQSLRKSGTDSGDVNNAGDTITVDTSSISAAGGSKQFSISVSESSKTGIKYDFTVTVGA